MPILADCSSISRGARSRRPRPWQCRWIEIAAALKEIQYPGPVVIESFTSEVKEIARAVCIWREIAPSQDAIASDGLTFLKSVLT